MTQNRYFVTRPSGEAVGVVAITLEEFPRWLAGQSDDVRRWLEANHFEPKAGAFCRVPGGKGELRQVILCLEKDDDFWSVAALPAALPEGSYRIERRWDRAQRQRAAIAWALGAYQFTAYKKAAPVSARLVLPKGVEASWIEQTVQAIYWVRDLINTPTDDLGPAELAEAAVGLAEQFGACVEQIVGDDLLRHNYPAIHTVGRASVHAPRLIDLRWNGGSGKKRLPKVALVGKGVCFDSGGLDLKSHENMSHMKKDMAGAAHALGLARLIMAEGLPISLRVLVPAVENAISGDAYHPGDVIITRKGCSVEVLNTDAEGRLILSDCLTEACADEPDVLIDFASLTGAARVALGPEVPGLFSNQDALANEILACASDEQDPLWRMPLYRPYREYLESKIADIANMGSVPYGGAIFAALFLQEFVTPRTPWAHIDLMGFNLKTRPGRPEGGEAMGLRAVFSYLKRTFCQ